MLTQSPNVDYTIPDSDNPITIFTIGHGRISIYNLIRLLVLNRIQLVIDVRSIPYSRMAPQFNKNSLEMNLRESGFEYRYGGKHLGGFPTGKKPAPGMNIDYQWMAEQTIFKQGIRRVIELAERDRLVLLCAEENPYHCHRHHLITPALLKMGIQVIHIRHSGQRENVTEIHHELFDNPDGGKDGIN